MDNPAQQGICTCQGAPLKGAAMLGKPGAQPIEIATRGETLPRSGFAVPGPKLGEGLLGSAAAKDEQVTRAGHGHIEQAQFLAQEFARLAAARQPVGQTRVAFANIWRFDLRTEPMDLVQNDLGAKVREVESLAQIGHSDYGEFQALALVNAHEAHSIGAGHRRHFRFGLRPFLGFDEPKEAVEPLTLVLIELPSQRQ